MIYSAAGSRLRQSEYQVLDAQKFSSPWAATDWYTCGRWYQLPTVKHPTVDSSGLGLGRPLIRSNKAAGNQGRRWTFTEGGPSHTRRGWASRPARLPGHRGCSTIPRYPLVDFWGKLAWSRPSMGHDWPGCSPRYVLPKYGMYISRAATHPALVCCNFTISGVHILCPCCARFCLYP